jgi:Tfp pilus assembly protein PilX
MFPNTRKSRIVTRNDERGVAMLLSMFALLLLTGVALSMMFMSDTDAAINHNYRDSQKAYFAAQAGIGEAISRLMTDITPPPNAMPTTANGMMYYIVNTKGGSETVQPWNATNPFWDVELCKEGLYSGVTNSGTGTVCPANSSSFPSGTAWFQQFNSISPGTGTSAALDYKWVRISLKGNGSLGSPNYVDGTQPLTTQVCTDGTKESLLAAASCSASTPISLTPVWILTSLAVTPSGTRRVVQTEIAQVQLPPFPGALTFLGPGSQLAPPYDSPNSQPFHIDGNNHGSCPGSNHAAVVTTDNPTQTQVIDAIPNNRVGNYLGAGASVPDVEVMLTKNMSTQWQTPAMVEGVASQLKSAAQAANVYSGPQENINIGSQDSPQITYVDGDLTMTGSTRGGGILVVTGTLNMSGNSGFYGIILVIGQGVFQGNGGGNGEFDGTVLVANTRDSSGNVLPTLGNPFVNWSGGGGNGIYYNQCAINDITGALGFQTLASRELPY